MRICPHCQDGNPIVHSGRCKACYRDYQKRYMRDWRAGRRWSARANRKTGVKTPEGRLQVKRELLLVLGVTGCQHCGFTPTLDVEMAAIDFHHRVPTEKRFSVSGSDLQRNIASLQEEAAKCDVLCANCHRIHHASEGWLDRSAPAQ